MTVAELIEHLAAFPSDMLVIRGDDTGTGVDIQYVEEWTIANPDGDELNAVVVGVN